MRLCRESANFLFRAYLEALYANQRLKTEHVRQRGNVTMATLYAYETLKCQTEL